MHTRIPIPAAAALVVLMGSMIVPSAALADASSLFKQLAGSWRGVGELVLEDGTRQQLSCRGYYVLKSEGHGLSIASLCNSPSQKFELRSLVAESASGISGQWEERTFHATGQVSGSASGTAINLTFSGTIEGTIAISLTGQTHSVNVSAAGAGIKGVSISLTRG
ncbi:MAG: hypothetical protein WBP94_06185 [Rhodomicrobiaceae bacterium]